MGMCLREWLRNFYCCGLCVLVMPAAVYAGDDSDLRTTVDEQKQTIDALGERVERLERERSESLVASIESIEDQEDDGQKVGIFDALDMDIGGFITQTLTVAHGDDSTEVSPNQTLLELLLRATIQERTTIFAALGWLREADLDLSDSRNPTFRNQANRTPQIIAWANYRHQDSLQLRLGRIVTPHGIINVEHFPPTLLEINQPQFLRPFSGATIFPNFMSGAEIHGLTRAGPGVFKYSAFGGVIGSAPNNWIAGGRTEWTWSPKGLTVGLNASRGARETGGLALGNFSTVPPASTVENDYALIGADILFDHGRVLWKNEVFYTFENGEQDRFAFYTQPAFRLCDEWIVFYRFDYLDPGQNAETTLEHVAGINFLPHPLVRIRGAAFFKDYRNSSDDVIVGQLSVTLSF